MIHKASKITGIILFWIFVPAFWYILISKMFYSLGICIWDQGNFSYPMHTLEMILICCMGLGGSFILLKLLHPERSFKKILKDFLNSSQYQFMSD
ncbi:MAG: hypothetical protein ABIF08_03780 [Nanoarchaeota archaeon]